MRYTVPCDPATVIKKHGTDLKQLTGQNRLLSALTIGLLLLIWSSASSARDYDPRKDPAPGGIAVIELPASLGTEQKPEAYYQGQRVFVMNRPYNRKSDNRWVAWIGIPLDTKPGKTPLVIEQPNGRSRQIMVNVRPSKQQDRFLVSRSPVNKNLTQAQRKQIAQDQAAVIQQIQRWNGKLPDDRVFLHPTRGEVLRPFGERVFMNGELQSSHNGIDLSGKRAVSPIDGTVEMIDDLFYGGKTVIIDHGHGLYTHYSHLNRINFRIREGQRIRRGEEIGQTGTTGHHIKPGQDYAAPIKRRHLHWGISLNGVFVDPELFLGNASR